MNKTIPIRKKTVLALLALFLMSSGIYAATFTAVASGNWSSSSTWGTTAPSFTNTGDQITIPSGITVTMDNNVTVNGSLAELKVNGALTGSSSTTLSIESGTLSGGGSISTGTVSFGAGAIITFTGTITTDNLSTATLSLKSGATIIVKQSLTLVSGVLSIESGGSISVNSGATVIVSGGSIVTNGGTATFSSGYSVTYLSSGITAGLELTGGTVNNLTINIPSGQKVTLAGDLTVTGTLTLTSGILNLGTGSLTLTGDVAASGSGSITSTLSSSIAINTNHSLTGALNFSGSSAVNNLTVNVGSGNHAEINGDLTVNGTLTLTSGTLIVSQSTFTIQGNIASSGSGVLSTSSNHLQEV
jgi:fibronectin-binding autotransporter adhesin